MFSVRQSIVWSWIPLLPTTAVLQAQVAWVQKLGETTRLAQGSGKLILIDVTASWSGPCRRMEKEVFSDAKFVEYSKNLIPMRLDAEEDVEGRTVAFRYDVQSFPTLLVINSKGEEIDRLIGYQGVEELITSLERIGQEPIPIKQLLEQARPAEIPAEIPPRVFPSHLV